MTVSESGVKRPRAASAADMDKVRIDSFVKHKVWLTRSHKRSQHRQRALQAADLEQFLFGSASAATDGFGKEIEDSYDESQVISAKIQCSARAYHPYSTLHLRTCSTPGYLTTCSRISVTAAEHVDCRLNCHGRQTDSLSHGRIARQQHLNLTLKAVMLQIQSPCTRLHHQPAAAGLPGMTQMTCLHKSTLQPSLASESSGRQSKTASFLVCTVHCSLQSSPCSLCMLLLLCCSCP